ncbi:SDR family NAD(P)-dependent oxidoreductase [Streptosporangiaceae bacterium NEAU-GS5]|nr:SDR family NAD(P)-dependent oxidoreductase [Streptosporangiaceae bacterium NEAU-GS5]
MNVEGDRTGDLAGRRCLITGGNRGIGLATAIEFAKAGGLVTLVCRDPGRAEAAVAEVRRAAGAESADHLIADLSSQKSIRLLADRVYERQPRLDVLVNNAAIVSPDRQITADGRELVFAVNHLAYFLLSRLLLDHLLASDDGVVINVATANHRDATENLEDLDAAEGYDMRAAYDRSKLANVSFTLELARRLAGTSVRVNGFCPGPVATQLLMEYRRVPSDLWKERLAGEDPPSTAARTALLLATTPGTGRYLEDGVDVDPSPAAADRDLAARLWDRCSALTGLK